MCRLGVALVCVVLFAGAAFASVSALRLQPFETQISRTRRSSPTQTPAVEDNEVAEGRDRKTRVQEQTVVGALSDVFTAFGDVATAFTQVKFIPDKTEGRGKMGKMTVPLIIGFKVAGAIVAAIAALKVLVMKTVAMSSLALLVSGAVAAKYIYDKMQQNKHHDLHQTTPYYYAPIAQDAVAWDPSYDVQTAHTDLTAGHQSADLTAYHSSPLIQTAQPVVNQSAQSAYTFIPGVSAAQRKSFRPSPVYQPVTVYKNIKKIVTT